MHIKVDLAGWHKTAPHSGKAGSWNHGYISSVGKSSGKTEGWALLVSEAQALTVVNTVDIIPGQWGKNFSMLFLKFYLETDFYSWAFNLQNAFEMSTFIWSLVRAVLS